jgi:hypothetical protein
MVNIVYNIPKLQFQSPNIGKGRIVKNPNNHKFVKQLIEGGTKILKAPNPVDPPNQVTKRNPFINMDLCHIGF